ncbi:MAG: DNA/RNA non-specific endonuclease [Elainella sp.]
MQRNGRQAIRRWIIGVLIVVPLLTGCTGLLSQVSAGQTPHLLLGKPSNATAFNANDYLIVRPQYALSYNRSKGTPNWVSWQLNADWLGTLPRLPFQPDTSLPQGWYQVQPSDYNGSGFDRGHMVPAADRDRTEADSKAVFLMTNILPQAPDNNQGPWEKLESYCRGLVRSGKELYITAGSFGQGGTGTKGQRSTIAQGKILVPNQLWKVVVILNQPASDPAAVTANASVIAVIMPNQQGIKETDWRTYQTSIDEVEKLTGYDLLSALSEPVQAALEAKLPTKTGS